MQEADPDALVDDEEAEEACVALAVRGFVRPGPNQFAWLTLHRAPTTPRTSASSRLDRR